MSDVLDYFSINSRFLKLRSIFSYRARKKIYIEFENVFGVNSDLNVLDVGVTPDTSLVESNFFEKLYPYKSKITGVSVENIDVLKKIYPEANFITIGKGKLPFENSQFDVAFSSAVIEHVGDYIDQKNFIQEIVRVSKKFFFTTPNRWYPVEFHTMLPLIHWLPRRLHQRFLKAFGYGFLSKTENLNLLTVNKIKKMMPASCEYYICKVKFLGLCSNLIVYGYKKE